MGVVIFCSVIENEKRSSFLVSIVVQESTSIL